MIDDHGHERPESADSPMSLAGSATPGALAVDDLAAIRARHRSRARADVCGATRCVGCGAVWPCDPARLVVALDAAGASGAALAADYDWAIGELTDAYARLDVAEVRLPTKRGGTLVVTAAELDAAWRAARGLHESARSWAAAWKRAARYWRRYATQDRLAARLALAVAVVEAARALGLAGVGGPARALVEALAAYDAATEEWP